MDSCYNGRKFLEVRSMDENNKVENEKVENEKVENSKVETEKANTPVNTDESKWTEDNQKELEVLEKWFRLKELRKAMEEEEKELQREKVQKKAKEKQEEEAKKKKETKEVLKNLGVGFDDDSDGVLPDDLENLLAAIEEVDGEYKNIEINPRLRATFIRMARGGEGSGVGLILEYGDYTSPTYPFAKKEIQSKNWEKILAEFLFNNEDKGYEKEEIRIIAEIARRTLEFSKAKDVSEKVSFRNLIRDLYYKAYTVKVKYSKKKPGIDMLWENWLDIKNIDGSIKTITLLDFRDYGECICICDKKKVLEELLKQLEIEKWTPLEFKVQLKTHDFLVNDKSDKYASLIQVKKLQEFENGLRKFLIIPVNRGKLKPWIEEIKQEIKGEDETETVEKVENE